MILPYQSIKDMTLGKNPIIKSSGINENQIQPASLDCRLGDEVFRVASSILPKLGEKISDILEDRALYKFDLRSGAVLEKGATYIIPLKESLELPEDIRVVSSTKSSIGRLDIFTRLLADDCPYFDRTRNGYKGPLYLEVAPLSFIIRVKSGLSLNQIRFIYVGSSVLSDVSLKIQYSTYNIFYDHNNEPILLGKAVIKENGLFFTVDLSHRKIVGFRAKRNPVAVIDLSKKSFYPIQDFWEPIQRPASGEIILIPDTFYLLASKERVRIPLEFCAEIVAYDVSTGEFRSHYAGFFDNGFGFGQNGECLGTTAVFEVRAHNVPLRLTDGQIIGKMIFEMTSEIPQMAYGSDLGSHYVGPNPRLSKYFKDFDKWV